MVSATMDILSSLKFKRSELQKVAEQVCQALADDPHSVDPADRVVFDELNWSERDIAREVGLCTSRKRWKREAGTNGQYADAIEQLDAVSKTVPKKVAELQAKVDELLAKIDDEKSKLTRAEQAVEGFENARRALRDNVPQFVRKQFDDEVARIRSTESAIHMRELQSRRDMIAKLLDELSVVNADTIQPIRLHCETCLPSALPVPSRTVQNLEIDQHQWHVYLEKLREELPFIEAELILLEADFADQLASAETILDYCLEGK